MSAEQATLLERVLACNAQFPVNEDGKYVLLSACEQQLAAYRLADGPDDALTYAVIRMLRHMRRHPEALALMQQRRPHLPEKAREVEFYELELHYLCGDRAGGDRLLQRFETGGKLRPSWKRSIERLRGRFENAAAWQELARLERALGALETTLEPRHLALLRTALPAANQALEVFCFLRDRLALLARLGPGPQQADLAAFDAYHRARLIACAGFGWSGSGAVAAFLSQHAQVGMPFGMAELGYLQGRGDREGFFAFLRPGALDGPGMKRLLATFLVESIACLRDFKQSYSVVMLYAAGPGGRMAALGRLLDDFHAAMLCADALAHLPVRCRIVALFLQRLLALGGGTHVLLNNVFLASKLDLVGWMEDARVIAAERDACDQFVARRLESGDLRDQQLADFLPVLGATREAFARARAALAPEQARQRLLLLRFEDFVRDAAVRDEVLDWLGLPRDGLVPDPGKFDAGVSAGNVGIHAGQLGPDDIARIEQGPGRYMR